jgi:hypothetical protein
MALIVEDGSVVAGAESFISVEDATAYFAALGNATWSGLASDTVREQLLRKAAIFMEGRYGLRWKGDRVSEDQVLGWPRANVYANGYLLDDDAVPEAVKRACAELAVRASADDLLPDAEAQVVQETVGPLSVTYAPGARQGTAYKAVDALLAPYLRAAGQIAVVRA